MPTMTVERLTAEAGADDVAAVLARDGCCVVERLVDGDVMDRLWAEMAPYVEATRLGRDDFSGTETRRTGSLIARSPTFRDHMVAHPLVIATTDAVLKPHAPRTQLHLTQVIDIGPGENGQMLHRDQWAFDFAFPAGMECLCNTMWALTDFTEANGGTRVIPGSNHWPDKLKPTYEESVGVAMPKGSALFYTGTVYHGGGANTTAERRRGVNVALHAVVAAPGGEPVPGLPAGGRPDPAHPAAAPHRLLDGRLRARLLRRRAGPPRGARHRPPQRPRQRPVHDHRHGVRPVTASASTQISVLDEPEKVGLSGERLDADPGRSSTSATWRPASWPAC